MADPIAPPPVPPADPQAMRNQFYKSKQDATNAQFNSAQQQQSDAVSRRMAALGQTGSGAAIGLQMKGQQGIEGQRSQALNELSGQEMQANAASQEAALGRQFQASESGLGRQFQSAEAQKQRDYQGAQFDKEFGLKQDAEGLAHDQFLQDQATTAYNQAMTTVQSPYSASRMQGDMNSILQNLAAIKANGGVPPAPQATAVPPSAPSPAIAAARRAPMSRSV